MVNMLVSLDRPDSDQLVFFARKADHTMGLIGFLKAQLGIPRAGVQPVRAIFHHLIHGVFPNCLSSSIGQVLKIELYGPVGLRAFIRTVLNMTDSQCQDKYVVHELLRPGEQPSAPCTANEMRPNEAEGRDIVCGQDGFWRGCVEAWSNRARRNIVVDVGQVVHRGMPHSEESFIH